MNYKPAAKTRELPGCGRWKALDFRPQPPKNSVVLKSIDILLGLTVVMLVASMAVTVLTEFVTNLFNNRGRNLKSGLTDLLREIDKNLDSDTAAHIADKILTHPLVCESFGRLGSVIHREELTKLLMELATEKGPHTLEAGPRDLLKKTLSANGIPDPEATLKSIRTTAMQLEATHPELASYARQNLAILQEAASDFVAKVNGRFDGTIDRVTARFTFTTRGLTFLNGLLIALVIQLDTVALVNRLATDDALRNSLVEQAVKLDQSKLKSSAPDPDIFKENIGKLASNDLITVPLLDQWWRKWSWAKLPGILISTMLLSLGAPFWYNSLKSLLKLRSALAEKDDAQRADRQSKPEVAAPPAILAGNRPPPA